MIAATILLILAIGALLVPDLRAGPGTWIVSGVLVMVAVMTLVFRPPATSSRSAITSPE